MKQRPGVLKRQREVKKMEKQREKAEKRAQRKLDRAAGIVDPSDDEEEIPEE